MGEYAPGLAQDVSLPEPPAEIVRLSHELEQERLRGRLLAHDLRNILTVITGYGDLMLKRMDPIDPLRTDAESIRKAAVWGLNLTQDVLTSSRATMPVPSTLDVNAVVAGVACTLQPLLGEHVEVVLRLEPELGCVTVDAGAGPLEQALMNLVLNACDAMPSGGRVTIEAGSATLTQSSAGPLPAVFVRVSDTGCGMDAATLSRAFEPYFTTKPPGKGTGLGLALVSAFVTQSGGHIEATSEVGRGSAFTLYLPRAAEADEVTAPADAKIVLGSAASIPMMPRGYWRHSTNGQIWAVETEGGRPVKCCGPLEARDVDPMLLPYLDYSTRDVGFLRADWRSWVPYVLCSACGRVLRPGAATATNGATGCVHLDCSSHAS